ncbi:MAG: hypothetical protein ACI9IA_000199 [Enterobacterales bacterium]|jgi:hypothetical protein
MDATIKEFNKAMRLKMKTEREGGNIADLIKPVNVSDRSSWITVSSSVPKEISDRFNIALKNNGHSKSEIIKIAVLQYLEMFGDDDQMKAYAMFLKL